MREDLLRHPHRLPEFVELARQKPLLVRAQVAVLPLQGHGPGEIRAVLLEVPPERRLVRQVGPRRDPAVPGRRRCRRLRLRSPRPRRLSLAVEPLPPLPARFAHDERDAQRRQRHETVRHLHLARRPLLNVFQQGRAPPRRRRRVVHAAIQDLLEGGREGLVVRPVRAFPEEPPRDQGREEPCEGLALAAALALGEAAQHCCFTPR